MYNKNQLKIVDKLLAKKFAYIISKTNYRFLFNSIIGIVVSIDTWPREDVVLELLKNCQKMISIFLNFSFYVIHKR